jgi:hypothetical protein
MFANGSVVVITPSKVGPSWEWQIRGEPELYFEYLNDSDAENVTGFPLLHLSSISNLPYPAALTTAAIGGGYERTVLFDGSRSEGCAFSVPVGNYTISVKSDFGGGFVGGLVHGDGREFSAQVRGDNFYDSVSLSLATATATARATPTDIFTIWFIRSRGCIYERMRILEIFGPIVFGFLPW